MFGIYLTTVYWGNTVQEYLFSLGLLVVIAALFKLIQLFILNHLKHVFKKTDTLFDDTVIKVITSINGWYYPLAALYFALSPLTLPTYIDRSALYIFIIATTVQCIAAAQIFVDYAIRNKVEIVDIDSASSLINLINTIVGAVLWGLGLLFILSNMGINVTSLITGLGIGGIAVALAVQNILGDLLSSLAIFFDKPFSVGDFIIVGEDKGEVEKIGIKTTRIRSLSGEELIIPNNKITSTRVNNFGRMEERRGKFTLGVTYDTPTEKLEKIPEMINKIIESQKNIRLDRSNLAAYGDSAIIFESIYFVLSDDYAEFANTHQNILLEIRRQFDQEGIEMAFPTQTVYVKQEEEK